MAESRRVQVVLLDDRKLSFNVQPKMYTGDLFDIVTSNFNLKEKEYFSLYYMDDTGYQQWLQTDRKVLDHDLPKKTDPILLYFAVRFYVENICYLQDSVSVELYYLQARQLVYRGIIECDSTTVFELAAYALQVSYENLTNDNQAREALKKLPVFPTSTFREHPSMQLCEDQVLKRYYAMNGLMRGQAIISYMCIVEKLPTYGIHYYEVKDKQAIPWYLGLSFKGIAQFDFSDKRTPRKVFPWKYLENLYFRDKKFSIEVHDPKRIVHTLSSFNLYEDVIREPEDECDDLSDAISDPTTQVSVSRRTFGPSNVNVYAWFTTKPQLTKCIWSMAVCQHQFFLDRIQNKTLSLSLLLQKAALTGLDYLHLSTMSLGRKRTQRHKKPIPSVWLALPWAPATLMVKRCPNQIADELSMSSTSLLSLHSSNPHSVTADPTELDMDYNRKIRRADESKPDLSPEEKERQLEIYKGLGERKKKFEKVLQEKIKELKEICIQEGNITGELPHEYTMFMTSGERTPTIKKRMGTKFSIADLVSKDSDVLSKLEMEYEVQKQITKAKQKLANDESLSKHVRKKHKDDYQKDQSKLKELEESLKRARTQQGLDAGSFTSEDSLSLGSSPALNKSPKKSMSSQQLEALEHSPLSRRRINSMNKPMGNVQKSRSGTRLFDTHSNQSSTSSLASLTHLEGYNPEFTPTRALKYNRSMNSTAQRQTDLDSVGSSTANSSSSSLHAYSVSNGRPLRSGSMDDVRLASDGTVMSNTLQSQTSDKSLNGSSSTMTRTSRPVLSNNPYGSLERRALKLRRSANRKSTEFSVNNNEFNPQNQRVIDNLHAQHQHHQQHPPRASGYRPPPPEYRPSPSQPDLHSYSRGQHNPHPGHIRQNQATPAAHREYAQNVHRASRKMYDSAASQPFQMLDNPYYTQRRKPTDQGISHGLAETHIASGPMSSRPQNIQPRSNGDTYYTDSSSNQSSPKENAFNFFNTLNNIMQTGMDPYNMSASFDGSHPSSASRYPYMNEQSKPFEMKDFIQYNERLRRAQGRAVTNQRPPNLDQPPPPIAARTSGSRTPSSPGRSLESSRSASPYTGYPSAPSSVHNMMNGSSARSSPVVHAGNQIHSMHHSYSSNNLLPPRPARRSTCPSKDSSFNTGDVADNFSQEMLAWYQDLDPSQTSSTLV